jgi:hypothetical protein
MNCLKIEDDIMIDKKLKLDFGMKRVCMCAASSPNECICGAWDDIGNLRPYAERIKELERELASMTAEYNRLLKACQGK